MRQPWARNYKKPKTSPGLKPQEEGVARGTQQAWLQPGAEGQELQL